MSVKVCLAGATGWAGSSLAAAIHAAEDMELVGAVSRRRAGLSLGEALNITDLGSIVSGSVEKALATTCDVFVEYTKPDAARDHILQALEAGASSQPYVDGALLAIRKVATFTGLKRGLDSVMDFKSKIAR